MKKLVYIVLVALLAGCGASDACFKSTGSPATRQIDVSQTPFTKIYVFPGIALVVKEGPDYEISVQSGVNLIDDVQVDVSDGRLTLKDNSGCNLVRAYGQTKVFVTAPNIEEIFSNTEKDITSDGVLHYPILRLFSMDFFDGVGTGDFHIEVDNAQVVVEANHVAAFYLSGRTDQALYNFYDGVGRLEAGSLMADDVQVFHRGSNDMIVHAVQSLGGNLYSTGNLISTTHPPTVNITEHWSGRLRFD
ncbi:head GIN domain-containing protein [Flavobacterium selenitireducens]|uniref:head GIN domain-containing protein n=1 Tax=Flavobacterium selenitireducens TaxID=2722704 RepID=UPI00168B4620|nr:head GIN domain-containing protein [Flavobacterium selenitireducens]MBD3583199.1 DUF2807 domain-containing protein [Flavobacterium selenitireducens]